MGLMIPDGYEDMDGRSAMLLGEINGKLASLISEFHDEREQARVERRALFEKIGQHDVLRAEFDALTHKVDGMKSQIYSNKSEIDNLKNAHETESKINLHTVKLLSIFGTIVAGVSYALWWLGSIVFSHWNEVAAFLKGKP